MADRNKSPPDRGHPMPRRSTPEKSLTLQNHGLHRGASARLSPGAQISPVTKSPQRNSSDESHDTDAMKWFDRSNKNPGTRFSGTPMDVDPPFFQKESDSSNEEPQVALPKPLYPFAPHGVAPHTLGPRPAATPSSRADDFRSVIDDLTVENKRLKEELKRFKQFGSDMMNKEKLFEIKMHGLPRRKRRELEATLRDFAASLGDGSTDASPSRKRTSKHGSAGRGSNTSNSKHPSSSTSNSRPADSAYASASTGPSSAAPHSTPGTFTRPSAERSRSSDQKVDAYLKGIPEGMYPQRPAMTEKEKKKWVVKRLEQLFTGKLATTQLVPGLDRQMSDTILPPVLEAAREAQMQPLELTRKNRTRDRSTNDSNGEQTDSRDIGIGEGSGSGSGSGGRSGNNTSSPTDLPPDQRPTRVLDLDPDRAQIPADNLDYMRHVGGLSEGSTAARAFRSQDVSMDADGWMYLNLLCNMAQLHMMNVTPAFIRQAVTEKSTRFQLSPDGQKLRWRGGTEGTKFSGESSGDNSKHSPVTDESEASNENGQRKRRKLDEQSGKNQSKLGLESQNSSGDFHYKPIFVHQHSSMETSLDESESPISADDSKPANNSRWSLSGTASSGRKRRRVDGAIVYYSGAPFCTDLSGDTGDVSPTTYMISTGQEQSTELESSGLLDDARPSSGRTWSGSSLSFRPFVDGLSAVAENASSSPDSQPDLTMDDTDSAIELDFDFPWCDEPGKVHAKTLQPLLEPCGLGGVMPEDHFAVLAITRHPRNIRFDSDDYDTTEAIINRLATMSTASPQPTGPSRPVTPVVKYDFVSAKIRPLKPMPLPQPAMFYPPFSTSSESEDESSPESAGEADDDEMYDSPLSVPKRVNRSKSNVNTYPEGADLSSNDEEDDAEDDNGYEASVGSSVSPRTRNANKQRRQKSMSVATSASASAPASGKSVEAVRAGSSLATAGDVGSVYIATSQEEDA